MKLKRRNFLKATIGAIAALFAPKVVAGGVQTQSQTPGIILPEKSEPANGHNTTTAWPAKKKLIIGMSEEDYGCVGVDSALRKGAQASCRAWADLPNWKPEGDVWENDLSEPISRGFGDWDNVRNPEKAMKAYIERRKKHEEALSRVRV